MLTTIFLAGLLVTGSGATAPASQQIPPCSDDPAFAVLDFWVGEWTVWVEGQQVGTNLIRKEKQQVEAPPGSVRFRGTIARPDAAPYLDRTTLTPLADGIVRQHIEVSMDGGASWRTTFDAEYRPVR